MFFFYLKKREKEISMGLFLFLVFVTKPPLKVVVVAFTRLLVVGQLMLVLLIHSVIKLSLVQGITAALAAIVLEFPIPVKPSTTIRAVR
jgi:hypothetical protein